MEYKDKSAVISEDGVMRYNLIREWDGDKPNLLFVLLNPSTADAKQDDPTIRRCVGFAQRLGFGTMIVVNLFAYRCSKPKHLLNTHNIIGRDNDRYIINAAKRVSMIIVAWGCHKAVLRGDRSQKVLNILPKDKTFCLGKTKDGYPKHPLYVPYESKPISYW